MKFQEIGDIRRCSAGFRSDYLMFTPRCLLSGSCRRLKLRFIDADASENHSRSLKIETRALPPSRNIWSPRPSHSELVNYSVPVVEAEFSPEVAGHRSRVDRSPSHGLLGSFIYQPMSRAKHSNKNPSFSKHSQISSRHCEPLEAVSFLYLATMSSLRTSLTP